MNYPGFTRHLLYCCFLLFFSQFIAAQKLEVNSTVIYKIKINDDLENQNLDNSIKNRINAINEASQLIECQLHFNSRESVFYQVDKMSLDTDPYYKMASISVRGLYYINVQDSLKILNKNFSGVNFNILIPFKKEQWKIINETKQIGDFTCFKAQSLNSNLTVWFSNNIPVPFGPNGISGLPGLILEATISNKLTFYASTIKINNSIVKFIEVPKADKTIEEDLFLEMAGEKMAEFFNEH